MDMYATVFKQDPFDHKSGEKYKQSILVPGGSRDELDLVTVRCAEFLEFVTPIRGGLIVRIFCAGVPWPSTKLGSFHEYAGCCTGCAKEKTR